MHIEGSQILIYSSCQELSSNQALPLGNMFKMGGATKTPDSGWRNLFKRKSSKRNQDRDPSNVEFATAVLAAAFAIYSLEEANTPQNKSEKRKVVQPSTNEVTRRPTYNKTKITGDASMRRSTVKDHEGAGGPYLAPKTSRSSFVRPTLVADAWDKVESHGKKKKKAKQKIERTKSESELKFATKPATALSKQFESRG